MRQLLERALEAEGVGRTVDEVLDRVRAGDAQIWPGMKSLHVTELIRRPDGLSVNVWLSAGDMGELIEMAPGIMAWARRQGCIDATIEGRPGWEKVLKPLGFEKRAVTLGVRL